MKHKRWKLVGAAAGVLALMASGAGGAIALSEPNGSQPRGTAMWQSPDSSYFAGSNRVIRLEHSTVGKNGYLLGTLETSNNATSGDPHNPGFPVQQSSDEGRTWRSLTTIKDGETGKVGNFTHPWAKAWQPAIFEFPTAIGSYPAGTLLFVGNVVDGNDTSSTTTTTQFQSWHSADSGATWTYDGIIQQGGTFGLGIWEPFISLDGDGKINVTFADERQRGTYSQFIGHIVSNDGGKTWSAKKDGSTNYSPGLVRDVASSNSADRPGMPTIATMGNGNRILAYEYGNQVDASYGDFDARTKISTDGGKTWGSGPADIGTLAVNADGQLLNSSPYVTWIKGGGPNGTVVLAGKWLVGSDQKAVNVANNRDLDDAGGAIFTNANFGTGAWGTTTRALVPGAGIYRPYCYRNYSGSLLPSRNGLFVRGTSASYQSDKVCTEATDTANPGLLPFSSDFSTNRNRGWNNYGGSWLIDDGVLYENTGTDGSKSITGNTGWTDYTLQADVKMGSVTSQGLAGVNLRVSGPGVGAQKQKGYWAGVSGTTLQFGKHSGTGYTTLVSAAIPNGLGADKWYHLTVRASGCTFSVQGTPVGSTSAPLTLATYTDTSGCYTRGAVGVSQFGGIKGFFRNIGVTAGATPSASPGSYLAPFATGVEPNWATYGGAWSVNGSTESLRNTSSGAGDKQLYTPSNNWGDYTVQAAVTPASTSGSSSAGVLVRATSAGTGANAFKGYYAGITASGVVITKHDGSTATQLASAALPGITAGTEYKLTVSAIGCAITVTAVSNDSPVDAAQASVTDCTYRNGATGVRSVSTGASWRYFTATA